MAEVYGTIGGDIVELNNAATETSLRELIRVIQNQTKSLASNVGGGGTTSAAAANAASTSLGNLSKSSNTASTSSIELGANLRKVSDELLKFSAKLVQGTANASDLFESFAKLPGILGVVANGMKLVAKFQEENFATYQQITRAGANFGGSLTEMRVAMQGARLTSEEFSRILKANSDNFTRMGTDVNSGARAFFAFTSSLQESEVGKDLRALGITSDELNEGFATYIAATGGRTRQEMMDKESLTKSAKAYFEQLDALSTLTGISREQLEKEQKERAANAAMQNYLQSLEPAEREKANRALQEAMARGGKGAEQALLSRLMGIPPLTPAAQQFETVTRNAAQQLGTVVDSVKDTSKSLDDVSAASAGISTGLARDARENQQLFRVLSLQEGEFSNTANKALAEANKQQIQGVQNIQDEQARRAEIERQQRERQLRSEAEQMAASKKALEDLGVAILTALAPAISALTVVVKYVSEFIRDTTIPIIKSITSAFEFLWPYILRGWQVFKDFLNPILKTVGEVFDDTATIVGTFLNWYLENLGKLLKFLGDTVRTVWGYLDKQFGPAVREIGDFVKNVLLKSFNDLKARLDRIKQVFNDLDEQLGGKLSVTLAGLITAIALYAAWMNRQRIIDAAKTVAGKLPGIGGGKPGSNIGTPMFVKIIGTTAPLPVTMQGGTTPQPKPGSTPANALFVRIASPLPLPVIMQGGTTPQPKPGSTPANALFVRIISPLPLPVTVQGGIPGGSGRRRRRPPRSGSPPVPAPGGGGGRPPPVPGGGGAGGGLPPPPPPPPAPRPSPVPAPGGGGAGGAPTPVPGGGGVPPPPAPRPLPGRFGSFLGTLKGIPGAAAVVGALDVASILYQSGEMTDDEFYNEISRAIGSAFGGVAGAALLAPLGSFIPGIGNLIAGGIGYFGGSYLGSFIAQKIVDWIRDEKNTSGAGGVVQGGAAFAEGGYVTKPTFGLVGEGGEPEIIAPESKMREIIDEAVAKRSATGGNVPDTAMLSNLESMNSAMKTLNTLVTDLIKYSKETAEYARRNEEATKNLNGNLFA